MCFSATASLGVGSVLSVVGIATMRKTTAPSQIIFAAIPLVFGIQQLSEGFVWLSLTHEAYSSWQHPAAAVFLIFAQVIWPFWVALSMLLIEKDAGRRKILFILLGIGLVIAACLSFRLMTQHFFAEISSNHIVYLFPDSPPSRFLFGLFGTLYVISTAIPPLISSIKKMWVLTFFIILSYAVAKFFYSNYALSVWCFFASLISILVYSILVNHVKSFSEKEVSRINQQDYINRET